MGAEIDCFEIVIESKVERAIEEAASKCAEESEYIAVTADKEVLEEATNIRQRRAR